MTWFRAWRTRRLLERLAETEARIAVWMEVINMQTTVGGHAIMHLEQLRGRQARLKQRLREREARSKPDA